MTEKLLIIVPDYIPTVEIIVRTLRYLEPQYEIHVVTINALNYKQFFSGEYKLLLIRQCDPSCAYLLSLIHRYHIKYFYYIDDNFWKIDGNTPLAKYFQHKSVIKTLNNFVSNAQLVIAGSKYLAEYIARYNPNITHIDAAFDFSITQGLEKRPRTKKIKIVYSGSIYRDQDFICVIDALKKILIEYSDVVEIYFYGYVPQQLENFNNVIFDRNAYPYVDYIKMQFQAGFDIGLAPLADTMSNRSKSNLKYREYSACGIAGVYTNIPPYSKCVSNFNNGLLVAQTTEAWFEAIKLLIEDAPLRKNIVEVAYADVFENYSNKTIAHQWRLLLDKIPYNKKIKRPGMVTIFDKMQLWMGIFNYKLKRVYDYYTCYGLVFTLKKIWKAVF